MPVIRDANIINRKESFLSVFLWNYFLAGNKFSASGIIFSGNEIKLFFYRGFFLHNTPHSIIYLK